MKAFVAVLFVVAAANAGLIAAPVTTIVRAPSLDSAVIKSDRIGGNFAYSVSEAHAHIAHTPVVQHVATPVAVSYSAPAVVAAPAYHAIAAPAYHTIAAPAVRAIAHPAAAVNVLGAHHVLGGHVLGGHVLGGHVIGAPAGTVRIA